MRTLQGGRTFKVFPQLPIRLKQKRGGGMLYYSYRGTVHMASKKINHPVASTFS